MESCSVGRRAICKGTIPNEQHFTCGERRRQTNMHARKYDFLKWMLSSCRQCHATYRDTRYRRSGTTLDDTPELRIPCPGSPATRRKGMAAHALAPTKEFSPLVRAQNLRQPHPRFLPACYRRRSTFESRTEGSFSTIPMSEPTLRLPERRGVLAALLLFHEAGARCLGAIARHRAATLFRFVK